MKNLTEQFITKYGDKAVWQVDTLLIKFAKLIELEVQIKMFQGGEQRNRMQKEIDELKREIL